MAVRTVKLGGSDWSDGEVLDGADLNDTFDATNDNISQIIEVYTGTDFDTDARANSSTSPSVTDEQSHEFTAITAADLTNKNYIKVYMTVTFSATASGSADGQAYLKVQSKEIGGAYTDSLVYTSLGKAEDDGEGEVNYQTVSINYLYTLTAGEKTNGVQLKIFSKSVANEGSADSGKAIVNNVQTYLQSII